MRVQFEYPLSDTAKWEGRLKITATVDREDVEIEKIIHEDASGHRSNITYLVEQWGDNCLYDKLCDMAINNACNLGKMEEEDYTMTMQND